ncbi:hypothetical protein B0A49_09983 [Cryomyces minteri]|uniref:FAD/NAD(P)-binding domain-containing protein n=1 Tax=Cryomyces minteri TaxID=331657 RepID=A0A4U0WJL1_9PEZI|nr:hypothetical protein B0A49_09983 [Cryomyces minteri]
MSAIPTLPEDGMQAQGETPILSLKVNGISHIENIVPEASHTNGVDGEVKTTSDFKIRDVPVENFRPVKVIVIGAGYSGIYCGIRIPERIRNCRLTIYEKNAGVGGTCYEFKNKRIGVIGSGSSAIQIVPNLRKISGTQLSCFVRSKTWISPPFGQALWDSLGMTSFEFSEDQKRRFHEDPEYYYKFRMDIEQGGNAEHEVTIMGTAKQKGAQSAFAEGMKQRLQKKPEIFEAIKPAFAPGCRRLTPGPGYLEALVEDNVSFVRDQISAVEEKGVRTADGKLHEIDVLVCATGFHTSAPPPFSVAGLDGQTIQKHWAERATTYLSLTTDNFPNHFMMLGPNAAIGTGSLTMMIENVGDYIIKCVRKLQKENIKSMTVNPARVRDFTRYIDAYFKGTVFLDDCKSWYRKGDRITGLWPGSTLHCIEALRSPRWEDYEYEYLEEEDGRPGNQLAWLGNGWTQNQVENRDLAWYLTPMFLEKPAYPLPEESERYKVRPFSH